MDLLHWIGTIAGIGCIISVIIIFSMSWKELSTTQKIVYCLMILSAIFGVIGLVQTGLNSSINPLMIIAG